MKNILLVGGSGFLGGHVALLELLPNPPLSVDNLDSMDVDSVCPGGDLLPFGATPAALEAVAPEYLAASAPRYRYYGYRLKARR